MRFTLVTNLKARAVEVQSTNIICSTKTTKTTIKKFRRRDLQSNDMLRRRPGRED